MRLVARRLSSAAPFRRVFGGETFGHGRSYAASAGDFVAADAQPALRRRTKVTLDQRRAMLESYVNEYRAMNSGKFPPPSHAREQVGGSYYVIKKFVQELEYDSRMSTTSRRDKNGQQKDIIEQGKSIDDPNVSSTKMTASIIKSSTEVDETISKQKQKDMGIHENAQASAANIVDSDISKANDELALTCSRKMSLDEVEGPSATPADTPETIKVKNHQLKEGAVSFHQSSDKEVDNAKEESASGSVLSDKLKSEAKQVHHAEKSEATRNLSTEHGDDTQPQRKSFVWENLKSLATEIANIWRKL